MLKLQNKMKFFIALTFCSLASLFATAQVSGIVFVGSVSLKGTDQSYPYKLQFTDSAGIIKGYSITDLRGPNETRSTITGTINKSNKEITFKETNIVSTKSTSPKEDFCFIHGRIKVSTVKGTKLLKGHFEGINYDGKTPCGKGDILLFSAADVLDRLMGEMAKKDTTKNKIIPRSTDVQPEKVYQITPGSNMELSCETDSIIIDVWDNTKIDGDIVSIQQNGKTILDHYMLRADMKEIIVKLEQAINTITVIAISEGLEPPNTARLKIRSGNTVYYVDATSTIGKPVSITLKRNK